MKLKNLLISTLSLSLFIVSCTKEDISVTKPESALVSDVKTMSVNSTNSEITNNKAYIFIEPKSKYPMVATYLNSTNTNNTPRVKFAGFDSRIFISTANKIDFVRYFSMPHWNDGRLPSVISVDIPQSSDGVDSEGNPIISYNFKTVKIIKGTFNEWAWVTILIPTSAMSNDTKKQTKIEFYTKKGSTFVVKKTSMTMNSVLYGHLINYNGTIIPQGNYRIYSTYTSTNMNHKFNLTDDVYFRGSGN